MVFRDTSTIPNGSDPIVDSLRNSGIPVTRENWLGFNYPDGMPEEWTAEHEAQLPKPLRLIPEPDDDDLSDLLDKALAARERNLRNAATLVSELKAVGDAYTEKRRAQWREAQARRRVKLKAIGLPPEGGRKKRADR